MDEAIEAYFEATDNQIALDNLSVNSLGRASDLALSLPRAVYFANYIKSHPNILKIVTKLLNAFWLFPIHPFFIIYQFCQLMLYKIFIYPTSCNVNGDIILCTTTRADVVLRLNKIKRPHQWIIVPWVSLTTIPDGETKIDLMSLARWGDFVWAFINSFKVSISFAKSKFYQKSILQTYTAFKWFLSWRILTRSCANASTVWFANHFDRWAVLIDRIPVGARKVMLQHGLIYDDFQLPVKLKHVSEFYSFNGRNEKAFKKNVLLNTEKIKFCKLPANIELSNIPLEPQYKHSLLIIGQPIDMEKECAIVEKIYHEMPFVKIYLKPHPLFSTKGYDSLHDVPVSFVKGRFCFPQVDLAVTHYSTLGLEYEATGIPVIWHQDKTVDATVQDIMTYFTSACTGSH